MHEKQVLHKFKETVIAIANTLGQWAPGVDPGFSRFLEGGFICIKVWGVPFADFS